jgi:hypothetical protein
MVESQNSKTKRCDNKRVSMATNKHPTTEDSSKAVFSAVCNKAT